MSTVREYICQLSAEEKAYVAAHLNETDETRPTKIAEVKQWIIESEDLNAPTGMQLNFSTFVSLSEENSSTSFFFLFTQTISLFFASWERANSTWIKRNRNCEIITSKGRMCRNGMVTGIPFYQTCKSSSIWGNAICKYLISIHL